MKSKLLLVTLFFITLGFSQNKGTITGKLLDKDSGNESLPFANVVLKGTKIGTNTDIDGKYTLSVEAGNYTIVFSFLGYESVEVPVTVVANETKTINQSLTAGGYTLQDVVVTNNAGNREKESALLLDQKNAVQIKQEIGSEELSRKGVGDVAAAVAKTAGVSTQEGNSDVYIRGLGDRYNSTEMNGLPIPSNDPENKNISLDIFTTDIVQYISIDKSYNVKMYGDFAGGDVNIVSKDYKGNGMFEFSLGSRVNSNAVGQSGDFLLQQGPTKSGFVNYGVPANPLSGYNFTNSLDPVMEAPFGGDVSFKAGKTFNVGEQGNISLFGTGSFNSGYEYREGLSQNINAQGASLKSFNQENSNYNTSTTGMLNANYRINNDNKISYNFLFINTSQQTRDTYFGSDRDFDNANANLLVQRATFIQNTVFINQLLGKHKLNDKLDLDWAGSFNTVKGNMPDRTQNKMFYYPTTEIYNLAQRTTTDNQRYYQELTADDIAANLYLTYKLGDPTSGESKGKIVAGYNGKFKNLDFQAIQFNFNISQAGQNMSVNPDNLDAFFNQQNYNDSLFTIGSFAGLTPQTYTGEQEVNAGFGSIEYQMSEKLSGVLGLRYEQISQTVNWRTQLDSGGGSDTFERNEFLPSLVLKYELTDTQNLRFAASKTYTLPQFKERALFIYEDVMETKIGNPNLYPSQNYNVDIKWEMFPQNDELLSATVFGKYIKDPINEVVVASSSNDISWVNIGDLGYVYGIELEARKNLFDYGTDDLANNLSFGINASIMQTHQEIDSDKVREETNGRLNINITERTSGFTGASDVILNADISYAKNWSEDIGIMTTLSYNYYSDKLYAIGTEQKGNLVDKGMGSLDFVFKTQVSKNIGINFGANNLLNPQFKRVQENAGGDVLVFNYKKGLTFGLGVNYKF